MPSNDLLFALNPSVEGKIEILLMVAISRTPFFDIFLELAQKLSEHTVLLVYCSSDPLKQNLACICEDNRISYSDDIAKLCSKESRVVFLVSGRDPINWVRDPFFSSYSCGKIMLLRSSVYQSDEDSIAAVLDSLSGTEGIFEVEKVKDEWLKLSGGNVLSGENFLIIGGNEYSVIEPYIIEKNSGKNLLIEEFYEGQANRGERIIHIVEKSKYDDSGKIREGVTSIFDKKSWSPIKAINNPLREVPVHVDLFIALTGVVVEKKHVIFVGMPVTLDKDLGQIAHELEENMSNEVNALMQNGNFIVIRNLMPFFPRGYWGYYNNCLVENHEDSRTVWLPDFASFAEEEIADSAQLIQEYNKKLWEKIKFDVVFIKADFSDFSTSFGGLHCLTHELKKTL